MFSTKGLVSDVKDVPEAWVFSHYADIDINRFDGTDIKTKSVFNKEKTPSLFFYIKNGKYRFKDFSSGHTGDHIYFVQVMFNIDFEHTVYKIIRDYANRKDYVLPVLSSVSKYTVKEYELRKWTNSDVVFWTQFNISGHILNHFNVKALRSYVIGNEFNNIKTEKTYCYGYFNSLGELYKIYQPYSDRKFIMLKDYIQGSDQCQQKSYLIYQKSLKDIMSLYSFKLDIDIKAPNSENSYLSESMIKDDLKNYRKVMTWFDPDRAGIESSERYRDKYGIEPMFLNYGGKDLSGHIQMYGAKWAYFKTIILINKHLNNDKDN